MDVLFVRWCGAAGVEVPQFCVFYADSRCDADARGVAGGVGGCLGRVGFQEGGLQDFRSHFWCMSGTYAPRAGCMWPQDESVVQWIEYETEAFPKQLLGVLGWDVAGVF